MPIQTEAKVQRRLRMAQALAVLSARLVDTADIERAIAAAMQDIGEQIDADSVHLWGFQPETESFALGYTWSRSGESKASDTAQLPAEFVNRLTPHLCAGGCLEVAAHRLVEPDELACLQGWYSHTLHVFPLYTAEGLVGLLFCCDASGLVDDPVGGLPFVQAAGGILSGMLHIAHMMTTLEQRIAEQTREVAVFSDMTILAGSSENSADAIPAALSMIRETGGCDVICVHVRSSGGARFELSYQVGLGSGEDSHLLCIVADSVLNQRIQQTKMPVFINKLDASLPEVYLPGYQSYLGAPMVVRGVVQGIVSCYWKPAHSVSINQLSLLTALVNQLGVFLENQRLHQHAQKLAVLHERRRMARELHDSVTQSLYCLMLFSRAAREALADGNVERMAECLEQVETTALRSQGEMRLLLHQLRPPALESQGLIEALRTRLDLVERRLNIQVDLQIASLPNFNHDIEDALYHVAIEALNNVLKHADAGRISIWLQLDGDQVGLSVQDNGRGFDVERMVEGMGLRNMRDRIATLGGTIQIHSCPDKGTQVQARVLAGAARG